MKKKAKRPLLNEYGNAREFANMLDLVGKEMQEYSTAIIEAHAAGKDAKDVDWHWSTYALEAQGALYELMLADGTFT